jgi:NitT/TauT family transport system substrate-binding protein
MNKKPFILLGVVIVVCVSAVVFFSLKHAAMATPKTTLYLNWIYTGSFAGEVEGKTKFATQNKLALDIQQGGQGLDPLKLVENNDFGTAAADEILRANEKGADFVIIGVINDDSPTAFVALKSSGIKVPNDFVGKRVGILPFGSTGLVYQALLRKLNIDPKTITEVNVSPDLRPFITGATHDVQPVFIYDEPVTLDSQQVSYNLIEPKSYGVSFKGPCYFTRRATILKNPELVYAFVKTMAEGWATAIHNPDRAIEDLRAIDSQIDVGRELSVLKRGIPYFATADRKPLQSHPESWVPMLDDLVAFGVLKSKPTVDSFLDLSFIDRYYAEEPK